MSNPLLKTSIRLSAMLPPANQVCSVCKAQPAVMEGQANAKHQPVVKTGSSTCIGFDRNLFV